MDLLLCRAAMLRDSKALAWGCVIKYIRMAGIDVTQLQRATFRSGNLGPLKLLN